MRSNGAAAAWKDRAYELAEWAWARLVNRTDAWGGYRPEEEWGKEFTRRGGTTGKLGPQTTRKGRLTEATLARHFAGRRREAIVGLHSTSPENTSLWVGVDIDWHGPDSNAPEVNLAAALAWHDKLRALGFAPLLTESNGAGGYHLRALFAEPVPTPRVFDFLRWLTADHVRLGIPAPPETFPKQSRVAPPGQSGQFGNWLRLPGRHHTRKHWSSVWDGRRWLGGAGAVAFILSLSGDSSDLIPVDLPLPAPAPRPAVPGHYVCTPAVGGKGLAGRIAAYLRHLPNLGEGQGRDDVAYQFACWLVRDLRLSDETALAWLARWDAGNRPPKGDARLREILAGAHRYGRHGYGAGLTAPRTGRRRAHRLDHIRLTVEVDA
jgi:hypothetical protein